MEDFSLCVAPSVKDETDGATRRLGRLYLFRKFEFQGVIWGFIIPGVEKEFSFLNHQ